MATCYFNNNLDKGYRCEYEITDEKISVDVEGYDIEVENPSGISSLNIYYADRDILIIDSVQKKSYLLKKAVYGGYNSRVCSLDPAIISKFTAYEYFEAGTDEKVLSLLPSVPKVKSIRIYSEAISDYYHHPSVMVKNTDDDLTIILNKERKEEWAFINNNNIEKICIGDDWKSVSNNISISVEMNGYFGVTLIEEVDYTEVFKYVREIMVYMQLYYPGKFKIKRMSLKIDGRNYVYVSKSTRPVRYSDRIIEFSVKDDMLTFLQKCYTKMPYRDTEGATRNIPYVVMRTYRNVEDNFLMSFRFLEHYYKAKNPTWSNWKVIRKAISNHYKDKKLDRNTREKEVREIIALRNHYVHSGYYIHETKLLVTYKEGNVEKKYYVEANVSWLRDRVQMLYNIVIDVIFTELLEYSEYTYKNVF